MRLSQILALAAFLPTQLCPAEFTASQLLADVAARNQVRESQLRDYSALRTYQVLTPSGKIRSESKVAIRYRFPGPKIFQILHEQGSPIIRNMVLNPLIEHEAKTSSGDAKRESAITPANYKVELAGDAELEGRRCHVLRATPRRADKYLFEGTIWIDAEDLAIAQLEGHPLKNPSFWVKKVHFIREYQKIGPFWLPRQDTTVSDVRMFGKHTLSIHHENYHVNEAGSAPDGSRNSRFSAR
jgi:outer membrane lipoprotein-sorting protein